MMPVKKVALLINNLNPGGCERTAAFLLNHLKDSLEWYLVMFSNEVHYAIPHTIKRKVLDIEQKGWRQIKYSFLLPGAVGRLKQYLEAEGIDTLMTFNHLPAAIGGRLKLSGWPGRFIQNEQIHCTAYINAMPMAWKRVLKRREVRKYYPQADVIIANAFAIKDDLLENFGITPTRVAVIGNPIELDAIEELRKEDIGFSKPAGTFTFIHVGRFEPQKNHRLLLEAFRRISMPEARLWLVGGGSGVEEVQRLVNDWGLQERVIFWGVQPNPFKFLNQADAFVLSSDYEGFPNVLLEAMACNLPIISTNCESGPAELLSPDQRISPTLMKGIEICRYGILVPTGKADFLAEAMELLMENRSLASQLILGTAARLAPFEDSNVLRQFLSVI